MRILLVDDNFELLELYKDYFEDLGAQCYPCLSALDALEFLEAGHKTDIVISDVRLPELTGEEFANIVKLKFNLPIILMSGDYSRTVFENCDHFLLKPFEFDTLYSEVLKLTKKPEISLQL